MVKECRQLASEITEQGHKLVELIDKELKFKDIRTSVLANTLEMNHMESLVAEAMSNMQKQIEATQKALENFTLDESNLKSKIEKKKAELDRIEKRLGSMHGVRPPYMDEYEKVEVELKQVYHEYTAKFRHLSYLEQQLDGYYHQEFLHHEQTEFDLKEMQNKLQEEEILLKRGQTEYNDFDGITLLYLMFRE
jgi:clusterin-associated protein 1